MELLNNCDSAYPSGIKLVVSCRLGGQLDVSGVYPEETVNPCIVQYISLSLCVCVMYLCLNMETAYIKERNQRSVGALEKSIQRDTKSNGDIFAWLIVGKRFRIFSLHIDNPSAIICLPLRSAKHAQNTS